MLCFFYSCTVTKQTNSYISHACWLPQKNSGIVPRLIATTTAVRTLVVLITTTLLKNLVTLITSKKLGLDETQITIFELNQ